MDSKAQSSVPPYDPPAYSEMPPGSANSSGGAQAKQQPPPPTWGPNPPPPPGWTPHHPPTYGTINMQPTAVPQVVLIGGCPNCRVGVLQEEFTCLGIVCAILFFPIGILCCILLREKRCSNCGAQY